MTLNTTFYITTPGIDPHKMWNELLDMVEPEGFLRTRFGYTQIQKADEKGKGWGPTGSTMTNTQVGIGLKAWCFMWHNEDGSALAYDDEHNTDDPEKADYDKDIRFYPRGYIKLDFDTAYGYGDEYGGASDLHGRIVSGVPRLKDVVSSRVRVRTALPSTALSAPLVFLHMRKL